MRLPIARHHWYEIDDQPWYLLSNPIPKHWALTINCRFPSFLRLRVQAALTNFWTITVPFLQSASISSTLASTLRSLLGPSLTSYTFVDFCSGAGGPTRSIERSVNLKLRGNAAWSSNKSTSNDIELVRLNGVGKESTEEGVGFVLTDIHPHLEAWEKAAKRSDHLKYVRESVDAGNVPPDLLASVDGMSGAQQQRKVFRLFSLAFHHFDDPAATQILRNTLETSSGIGIFELQERTFEGWLTCLAIGPALFFGSWYWF